MNYIAIKNMNFPLSKGDSYVQERKEKERIAKIILRWVESGFIDSVNLDTFNCTVDNLLASKSFFSSSILCSLYSYLGIFIDEPNVKEIKIPLWIKLLKAGVGWRNFSEDTVSCVNNLFSIFGLESLEQTSRNLKDTQLLYKIGQYQTIESLEVANTDSSNSYFLRSQIWLDKINEKSLEDELNQLLIPDYEKRLIKSQYYSYQKSSTIIDCISKNDSFDNQDAILSEIQILNRINLFYFKKGDISKIKNNFSYLSKLLEQVKNTDVRSHLRGNILGHRAKIEMSLGNTDCATELLQEARKLDYGFYEYSYLLAQLNYEKYPEEALVFYRSALMEAPLFPELIFDYGRHLWETERKEEADDLEKIIIQLGIEVS